ncbi:MAG: DoxX family protein [Rhodoferax sp.]
MTSPTAPMQNKALPLLRTAQITITHLQAPAALAARIFVGMAFFRSGLTKIVDWDTTLALFADEYHVPLLPPHIAAFAGTFGELFFPVLLILGLFGRFSAMSLFFVNIVAVLSLSEIAPAALQQHQFWGTLLLALVLWGPGKWSIDAWWWPKFARQR